MLTFVGIFWHVSKRVTRRKSFYYAYFQIASSTLFLISGDDLLEFELPLENQIIRLQSPNHAKDLQLVCRLTQAAKGAQVRWSFNDQTRLPFDQFATSFDGQTARLHAKGLSPNRGQSGSYACEITLNSSSAGSMAFTQCQVTVVQEPGAGELDVLGAKLRWMGTNEPD